MVQKEWLLIMRVCVLTHTFPRNETDVAAAFMKAFCDGLSESGNDVTVVTAFDPIFYRKQDPFKVVLYKYIWPDSLHLLGYSRTMEADVELRKRAYLLVPFLIFFGIIALFRTVKKEKIDIINAHWIIPNGVIAFLVSKLTGVPYTVTLPGTDVYLALRYPLFGFVARFVANQSAGIFSNSSFNLQRFLKLGVKPKVQAVISYPTDVSRFVPLKSGLESLRRKLGLNKKNLVILAIGRMVYKKGFNYLIDAMPKVLEKYPNTRLIFGGEGDIQEEWRKLTRKLHIENKVLFVGTIKRDEIQYYYNLSDVMVAPSIVDKEGNVDGGPVVSFESMACGKPQVVTNVLGVADSIEDGINGFVVPQKNSKAIGESLAKLLQSKSLRERMGRINRQVVTSQLNTKTIGEKYTMFFNQILTRWQL